MGAFAPGNLTAQGSLDCRIGAVRMQTGGRLGALGGGRRAAPGTWLCVRPWPGTLRVCSPQPLVPSWVGSARLREEGPACVLRCALRGMEMGSRPPPHRGGEGFPALSGQAAPSGAVWVSSLGFVPFSH